jgi:protein-tyrosine phosphatase
MAAVAEQDGIHTILATPHTQNGVYENPPPLVQEQTGELTRRIADEGISLTVLPGAEVHISSGLAEKVHSGKVGTVNGGGRYILVEFPFQALPEGWSQELFQLNLEGIIPIIVHPERIFEFQRRFDLFFELVAMGCLTQVTAMSITGELGAPAMRCAHRLLRQRLAHMIASDAHSADNRPPALTAGVEAAAKLLEDPSEALEMVTLRPEAVLNGQPVSVPEPVKSERKKWWIFFQRRR